MIAIALTLPDGTKIAIAIKPPVKAGLSSRPPIDVPGDAVVEPQKARVA